MNKKNPIIYQDVEKAIFNIFSKHGTFECVVDIEDIKKIKDYKWHICTRNKKIYAVASCPEYLKNSVYIHSIITGNTLSDHIDGDVLNNRKSNLRECSKKQNNRNVTMHSGNRCGYKGVVLWNKKYRARITVNYKLINLGGFDTPEEAAKAYNEAAIKYFGEFAKLNKIA